MKKIVLVVIVISAFFTISCAQEQTEFSKEVLQSKFVNESGREVIFNEILEQSHKKTTLIDLWASWCSDCIKGMPDVKELQEKYEEK